MTSPESSRQHAAGVGSTRRATGAPPNGVERRKNPRLRELIDEMLVTVRVAVQRELWTPEERAQAERELGEIMSRIREQAISAPH